MLMISFVACLSCLFSGIYMLVASSNNDNETSGAVEVEMGGNVIPDASLAVAEEVTAVVATVLALGDNDSPEVAGKADVESPPERSPEGLDDNASEA